MSGPSLEPTGPAKASAVGSTRSRRKLLTAEEAELFELAQAAGTGIDPEVFKENQNGSHDNRAPNSVRSQQPGRVQPTSTAAAKRQPAAEDWEKHIAAWKEKGKRCPALGSE